MRIHRDGVELAYEEAGGGDPPLLLVHGWATDRRVMRPLYDDMRRSHRVIAVDLRGFGESDAPQQTYTIEGYAGDLAFLIARLGLPPPIVIGHSMGGIVALDLAARYANRISGAILLEAMVIAEPLLGRLRLILEDVRTESYRDVVARLMTHLMGPHFDPGVRARLVAFATSCAQHVLVSALEGILAFDSLRAASLVTCPLLYIGTHATYADLARFRAICPQLVTSQLAGCGHYFPLEVPDQLGAMIAGFLQTNGVALPP